MESDRRGHLQLMLAIVRLSIASHRGDLQAVVEQAHRLLAPAEATDVAQLGLGDDLRALALLEFGVAELVAGVAYAVHGVALLVQGRLAEAESWLQRAEGTRLAVVSPAGGLMLYVMRGLLEAATA